MQHAVHRRHARKVALFLVLAAAALAGADAARANSAQERVASDYLKAASAGGADAMTGFFLVAEMEEFRATVLKALEEEAARSDSAARERLFGAGSSLDALRRMTPPNFLLAITRNVALPAVPAKKVEVLGVIEEGKRAHTLARAWADDKGTGRSRLTVVTLVPHGKDWRVALPESFRARIDAVLAGEGRAGTAAAPPAAATPNTPEIMTLLETASKVLRDGNCATFFSVYYSPNFRRTKSQSAFRTLITKCTNSIDIREIYLTPLELAKRLNPRYENGGTRAVYDMRGQGLPFQHYALEKIDDRWFIAE